MEVYEECRPGKNCDKPDEKDCCKGKVRCKRPRSMRDIKTECIFVEKVFDARLFKREREVTADGIVVPIAPDLDAVDTANVECEILSFTTQITQLFVDGVEVDPLVTIPGPGGDQTLIPQTMVDTSECSKKCKGTKIQLRQRLEVTYNVQLTVTGTGTKGVIPLDYTGMTTTSGTFEFSTKFDDFCFPPTSLHPISVLDSCLANCFYDLASFTFNSSTNELTINGDIIFCMFCEKKLKVPVQICVLTTGPCKIKKSASFCDKQDFPSIFNACDCDCESDMDEMEDDIYSVEESVLD